MIIYCLWAKAYNFTRPLTISVHGKIALLSTFAPRILGLV